MIFEKGGVRVRLFTAEVGDFRRDRREISAAGYALVGYAARQVWGECPEIVRPERGRPYFDAAGRFFSLSHTGTRLLVGVSEHELGVDAERFRPVRAGLRERLMSPGERDEFELFELWTLREAVFKLTGRGALMSMELRRDGGEVVTPFAGVRCRSYGDLPGCAAAAAAFEGELPGKIEIVPPERFLT
ncbi:MAG: 4'-phosphopantetheinyl transferase superfamily protein [Butyricicoccus sp.]|nr:4'-phosphopantetheinyl transferase superfamily protein [Butyricicoccus sp.]